MASDQFCLSPLKVWHGALSLKSGYSKLGTHTHTHLNADTYWLFVQPQSCSNMRITAERPEFWKYGPKKPAVQINLWDFESMQSLSAAAQLWTPTPSQPPIYKHTQVFLILPNLTLSSLIHISREHKSWKICFLMRAFFFTVPFSLLAHMDYFSLLEKLVFKMRLNY